MNQQLYDVIIIGAGPAGLSAAIYMARAQYRVLVVEKEKIGGQITITSEVVNYPGVLETSGEALTKTMRDQAISFGAEFMIGEVKGVSLEDDIKVIETDKGELKSLGVIIATGASPRKIGFTGEKEFQGRGVAYCATCDGEFFTDLNVFVIGGGFAAVEEAIFLTKYAKQVTIMVREPEFTCEGSIIEEVMSHEKIEVNFETVLLGVEGESNLQKATFKNLVNDEVFEYHAETADGFGVFVFAGYVPATALIRDKVELNEQGYIVTDINKKTNVDGVYAAGDVCIKNLRQVVTAVSDGAVAATSLEKHVSQMYTKLNIKREKNVNSRKPRAAKQAEADDSNAGGAFITEAMKNQLLPVFEKFQKNVVLKAYLDDRPISKEVDNFLDEVKVLSDKIKVVKVNKDQENTEIRYPSIALFDEQEEYLGVQFHGVPGGHEFNSFIIALYNAAGPGQLIDETLLKRIKAYSNKVNIKVIVSLSCTMCPDLVMASSRIALENAHVEMEMYDMAHFEELRDQYQIKSVPCMIINNKIVHFGKKNIEQILDILETEV